MQTIEQLLSHHPFFSDMPPAVIQIIAGCGKNVQIEKDEMMFREGDRADAFYLIREGLVALEIASPKAGPITIQTVHSADVLGWSWLFPPFRWHFDARVVLPVRATMLDGKCLRKKCDADPVLGYEIMKRFAAIILQRLQATRLQLTDAFEAKAEER